MPVKETKFKLFGILTKNGITKQSKVCPTNPRLIFYSSQSSSNGKSTFEPSNLIYGKNTVFYNNCTHSHTDQFPLQPDDCSFTISLLQLCKRFPCSQLTSFAHPNGPIASRSLCPKISETAHDQRLHYKGSSDQQTNCWQGKVIFDRSRQISLYIGR